MTVIKYNMNDYIQHNYIDWAGISDEDRADLVVHQIKYWTFCRDMNSLNEMQNQIIGYIINTLMVYHSRVVGLDNDYANNPRAVLYLPDMARGFGYLLWLRPGLEEFLQEHDDENLLFDINDINVALDTIINVASKLVTPSDLDLCNRAFNGTIQRLNAKMFQESLKAFTNIPE